MIDREVRLHFMQGPMALVQMQPMALEVVRQDCDDKTMVFVDMTPQVHAYVAITDHTLRAIGADTAAVNSEIARRTETQYALIDQWAAQHGLQTRRESVVNGQQTRFLLSIRVVGGEFECPDAMRAELMDYTAGARPVAADRGWRPDLSATDWTVVVQREALASAATMKEASVVLATAAGEEDDATAAEMHKCGMCLLPYDDMVHSCITCKQMCRQCACNVHTHLCLALPSLHTCTEAISLID